MRSVTISYSEGQRHCL